MPFYTVSTRQTLVSQTRTFATASRRRRDDRADSTGKATPQLTHVDASGRPSMVDVSDKPITLRSATATGRIYLTPDSFPLVCPDANDHSGLLESDDLEVAQLKRKALSKGAVLPTAQLSGILAAKHTSSLIPLCHPIPLTHVSVDFFPEVETFSVRCEATASCEGKTGVEMEALVAVQGGLLCVWDMVKAVAGKEMRIGDVCVVRKSGGRSGDWVRDLDLEERSAITLHAPNPEAGAQRQD